MGQLLEYFKIPERQRECFRFNGASAGRALVNVTSSRDLLNITLANEYRENISPNEYFVYKFNIPDNLFRVFVSDNYLNSYLDIRPIYLAMENSHEVKVVKTDVERKLSEPYNNCRDPIGIEVSLLSSNYLFILFYVLTPIWHVFLTVRQLLRGSEP